jgi:hypothetical protein
MQTRLGAKSGFALLPFTCPVIKCSCPTLSPPCHPRADVRQTPGVGGVCSEHSAFISAPQLNDDFERSSEHEWILGNVHRYEKRIHIAASSALNLLRIVGIEEKIILSGYLG